jgi:HEAT repeat protein
MNNKTIENIFNQLYHKDFEAKQKAIKVLMNIRSIKFLNLIFERVKTNNEDDTNIFIIALCEKILSENKTSASSLAILILLKLYDSNSKTLSVKAESTLEFYYKNQNIVTTHKAVAIHQIWGQANTKDKIFLIKIIRNYKIQSLINLVITSFDNPDDGLIIEAIKTLNELKESRGNKELRKLVHSSNKKIQSLSIETIGITGTYFDYFLIKKYLFSEKSEIIMTTISSIRNLIGDRSLPIFNRIYPSLTIKNKKFLLNELSKINTQKSLKFLIELMNTEKNQKLITYIEWAIYNLTTKKKISTIIKAYKNKSKNTQYRLLNILSDFQDSRCKDHFISVLESSQHDHLKLMSINFLGAYDDKLTLMRLEEILSSTKKYNFKLTALRTLLRQKKSYSKGVFLKMLTKDFQDLDENTVLLLLKYIQNNKIIIDQKIKDDFIINCFDSKNKNIILSSFMAIEVHHNEYLFTYLLRSYYKEEYQFAINHLNLTITNILNVFPYYLTTNSVHLLPQRILNDLEIYVIPYQLLLHLLRISRLTQSPELSDFIESKIKLITKRSHQVLTDYGLSSDESIFIINFLIENDFKLSQLSFNLIKDNYYKLLNTRQKTRMISTLLENRSINTFDFIHNEYEYIVESESLMNQYQKYLEVYL